MTKLLFFPFGGNTLEALDCIGSSHELIGFIDDDSEKQSKAEYKVFSRNALLKYPDAKILAVPGNPSTFRGRAEIIRGLNIPQERFATLIHPSAQVSPRAKIGANVLIMAGVVVSGNVTIEDHVCILPNSVIHHDAVISSYSLIGSNVTIAGHSKIGENCYIGSGSSIINNIVIGARVMIGMGSNVIRDVLPDAVVAGNPARPIS